ncbi:MAG: FAD-dependent oxidoreductase [Acidimicrobiales bacterium]|nr:FAD-dependent oxidoreductase [Acidimicrobiales bacterium]
MSAVDLVVVGGGPAGLTAAWQAALDGRSVVLLERSGRLGGMAASVTISGQRVDLGSHRLHPAASPRVLELLRELLGDDLQTRERNGRLRLGDRWLSFPLRAGELLARSPRRFAARALADVATAPLRPSGGANFAEVVRNRFGQAVLDDFYGPYAEKLWGAPPEELSAELAHRRISASGPGDVVDRIRRARQPEGRSFLYPRMGYGQIVERLATAAEGAGAVLQLRRTVGAITRSPSAGLGNSVGTATVTTTDGESFEARRVLWTAPIAALVGAHDHAPPEVIAAAAGLRQRSMVLLYLVVPRPRYSDYDAHYIPTAEVALSRLSEPKNYRDGPDPAERTVLCAEIPCSAGDAVWRASDAELARLVERDLQQLGLPPSRCTAAVAFRLGSVYPVRDLDGELAIAQVQAWADSLPLTVALGRQGTFVADNLHHVMEMGLDAAAALGPDGTWDDAAWRTARMRHAQHVVED